MKAETRPGLRIALPATSANLGPGFDAVGLALAMHLTVEAHEAAAWDVQATGRDAALCGRLEGNLIVDTYRAAAERAGLDAPALRLSVHNEIPLGMGCGSSAAAILAGVALADHFCGWNADDARIVSEASRIEGHPDNVAACWNGGFTVSAMGEAGVETATFAGEPGWELMLAVPGESLATTAARALLPEVYTRADAVFNVQRTALLTAAFAQGRLDRLGAATGDRMHQPYREAACPLLQALRPLAGEAEIAAVTLSGAGPSVLLFLAQGVTPLEADVRVRAVVGAGVELLATRIAGGVVRTAL